jgi:hypothetical protein
MGASATTAAKEASVERKGTPSLALAQGAPPPFAQLSVDKDGRAQIVFGTGKPTSSFNNGNPSSKINHNKRAVNGHSGSTRRRGPLSPKKSAINRIPGLAGATGPRDSLKNCILPPPPPHAFVVPHTLKHKLDASPSSNGRSNSISKAMPTATAVRSGLGVNHGVETTLATKPAKPSNGKMPLLVAENTLTAIMNRHRDRLSPAAAPASTPMAADITPSAARPDSIVTSIPSTTNLVVNTNTHSTGAGLRPPQTPSQPPPKRKPSLALALAQATRKRPRTRRLQQKRRERRRLERGTSDVSSSASSSSSSDERRGRNKNGFEEDDDEEPNLDDESSDSEEGQEGQEGIIEGLLALREGNWR